MFMVLIQYVLFEYFKNQCAELTAELGMHANIFGSDDVKCNSGKVSLGESYLA
ncbi:MAG: hypothetical protein ACTH36_11275 [Pseudoalteromonas nigrifaciens]|uniref:hypothetical protein n=2 Tax=Pseudoalteromonas TaxID=53246 RepID=UPI001AD79CF0|nr:hypothetical protein [Pseudoalteromonas sp. K222D]